MGSNHSRKPRDLTNVLSIKWLHQAFEIRDGVLYWRSDRPASHFRSDDHKRRFSVQRAGKRAGTDKASIGYLQVRCNLPDGTRIFVYTHRIIFAMTYGFWPPVTMFVDHKSRNPLCNDPSELRLVTPQQNSVNHSMTPAYTYFGVYPTGNGKRYYAVFRRERLGTFDSEYEAAVARDKRVIALGLGPYARLNVLSYADNINSAPLVAANDNSKPEDGK